MFQEAAVSLGSVCLSQQKRIWANQHLRRNVRRAPHYHNSSTGSMLYFRVPSVKRKPHGGSLFACYFCFAVLPGCENIPLSEMMLSSCYVPPRAYGLWTYPDASAHTQKHEDMTHSHGKPHAERITSNHVTSRETVACSHRPMAALQRETPAAGRNAAAERLSYN